MASSRDHKAIGEAWAAEVAAIEAQTGRKVLLIKTLFERKDDDEDDDDEVSAVLMHSYSVISRELRIHVVRLQGSFLHCLINGARIDSYLNAMLSRFESVRCHVTLSFLLSSSSHHL
jgi:hypothetical protein